MQIQFNNFIWWYILIETVFFTIVGVNFSRSLSPFAWFCHHLGEEFSNKRCVLQTIAATIAAIVH